MVKEDPAQVLAILTELYGCVQSYVTLQQSFFSRKQQEGEMLLEFSLALMALMALMGRVKQLACLTQNFFFVTSLWSMCLMVPFAGN